MRRAFAVLTASLAVVAGAHGAPTPKVTRVAKPAFPPPLATVVREKGRRLELVSRTSREPGLLRSPALVANAENFVVTRGLIVSGYGFTAEKDWLPLVDPGTGHIRDRLALPSMAERITLRGGRIVVRCYDARVVVRLAGARG